MFSCLHHIIEVLLVLLSTRRWKPQPFNFHRWEWRNGNPVLTARLWVSCWGTWMSTRAPEWEASFSDTLSFGLSHGCSMPKDLSLALSLDSALCLLTLPPHSCSSCYCIPAFHSVILSEMVSFPPAWGLLCQVGIQSHCCIFLLSLFCSTADILSWTCILCPSSDFSAT